MLTKEQCAHWGTKFSFDESCLFTSKGEISRILATRSNADIRIISRQRGKVGTTNVRFGLKIKEKHEVY